MKLLWGSSTFHDKEVVHGDLTCSNILVGSDGRAKLSDFGFRMLESAVSAANNHPEVKFKSVDEAAPEVLEREKTSFASDIYSFGTCILQAMSGKWWQSVDTPRYAANFGDDVHELVQRMCQRSPSDRISIAKVVDWLAERVRSCCPGNGPQLNELGNLRGDVEGDAKYDESECSALSCDLTAYMSRSTSSSIVDFAIPAAISASHTTKTWFIDQKDITFASTKAFGRGGYAKVYRRQAPVVLRRVQIRNEEDLATFLNEVKIWYKLRHPHIVQLFGACHINQPFFVCEFAAGGPIE